MKQMALGFSVNVQFSLRCFINHITLLIFSDKSFMNDRIKSFWKVLNSIKSFWIMKGFGNFTVLMLISAVVKITNIWAPDILSVKKIGKSWSEKSVQFSLGPEDAVNSRTLPGWFPWMLGKYHFWNGWL